MRFISIYKTQERSAPPSPEHIATMGKFCEEMSKAGVLLATEGCQPSVKGFRVRQAGGKLTVTDGPFTESKELVAGFALLEVTSKEQLLEVTKRFLELAGDGEAELRQIFEPGFLPLGAKQ
jgi:hypothetical protein